MELIFKDFMLSIKIGIINNANSIPNHCDLVNAEYCLRVVLLYSGTL